MTWDFLTPDSPLQHQGTVSLGDQDDRHMPWGDGFQLQNEGWLKISGYNRCDQARGASDSM